MEEFVVYEEAALDPALEVARFSSESEAEAEAARLHEAARADGHLYVYFGVREASDFERYEAEELAAYE